MNTTDPEGTPEGGIPPWSASQQEVTRFVARHGARYDPEVDDYRDPGPFARPVKAGKNSPIYNAHSYHTKVPPEGIVEYLEHYTGPGDLVLDPFCGSGMTGVACIMTGRHSILNDLSPAATHIAYNYCTPVDLGVLRAEWDQIKSAVKKEFEWLYGTTCDGCGGPATIQHTVWSDVCRCRVCQGEIVLWDAAVVRQPTARGFDPPLSSTAMPGPHWQPATPETAPPKRGGDGSETMTQKGSVLNVFSCPQCGTPSRKTQLTRLRSEPVLTVYECARCRARHRQHPTTTAEKECIQEINRRETPYWYPTTPFESTREMWRGGHRDSGINRVCDFWTKRNLWALARLWHEATHMSQRRMTESMLFALTSCMLKASLTTRFNFWKRGNSTLTGTLYIGSFVTENNLLDVAERKMQDIVSGLRAVAAKGHTATIITQHAGQDLPIPANSVDYIFTDPPFGSNIFYSDVNLLWEAWLGCLTDDTYEAVWNRKRKTHEGGKTLDDYRCLMADAFAEMHRVLKPGRWASVVFHNSDDRVWDAIRGAASAAGFVLEDAQAFDKQQKSFKGIRGEKGLERVSNLDIVLSLHKPKEAAPARMQTSGKAVGAVPPLGNCQVGLSADVTQAIAERTEAYLRSVAYRESETTASMSSAHGQDPRGVQAIHSQIVQRLINDRSPINVSMTQVVKVLEGFFKQVDGRWYLLGEEVRSLKSPQSNATEPTQDAWQVAFATPRDEATTIEWIRAVIRSDGPQLEGDLKDRFRLSAPTLTLGKDISRILDENFVYDKRRGRWRVPSAAEAEAKFSVKVRLLEGRVQGVLDGSAQAPDAEGLGQLLEACFDDGLYQHAYDLWRKIDESDLPVARYKILTRKARVSRLRAESVVPDG